MIDKIKEWLEDEVEDVNTEFSKKNFYESEDDYIILGRKECAESLLNQIKKWEEGEK
mgnify:FL=1